MDSVITTPWCAFPGDSHWPAHAYNTELFAASDCHLRGPQMAKPSRNFLRNLCKEYIDVNGTAINHNCSLWYIPIDIDTMDQPAMENIPLVGRCLQRDGLAAEISAQAANRAGGRGWIHVYDLYNNKRRATDRIKVCPDGLVAVDHQGNRIIGTRQITRPIFEEPVLVVGDGRQGCGLAPVVKTTACDPPRNRIAKSIDVRT